MITSAGMLGDGSHTRRPFTARRAARAWKIATGPARQGATRSRGSTRWPAYPTPIALAFANIQKAARYYGVDLSETDWHQLGVHPQQNRQAAAAKADTDVNLGEFLRLGAATVPAALAVSTLMLWSGVKVGL
jgi:hypothetical protein